ncbi:MAG: 23S rRNA (adenine(2503)-C(2))-methyltransferase RlmN [Clostridia bacterium]|nr:23S rRNA (adenine(2503)-C(2))-methyltransferase RlmN [Clostridia bacterium]
MTDTAKKPDVGSMSIEELQEFFTGIGEPKFRAKQLFSAFAAGKRLEEITNFSNALRKKLSECVEYRMPEIEQKQVSRLDGTVKYLFRLTDGEYVESVLMKYAHGNTICVSSQVGCRMGCAFCASTIGGKVRDLTASEIYGQVCMAQRDSGERIGGIVMMGIGEPLDNLDNVLRFLHLVNDENGLNIGYRHISLSTCGVADKIYELKKADLPITLSISLHAATDEARSAVMPVNRKYPLDTLLTACKDYFDATSRRISFEYTLLYGKNDTLEDAAALARLLRRYFPGKTPVHINLIRLNPVKERSFETPDDSRAYAFCAELERLGMNATLRRRLGKDIDAACGQLRRKRENT